MNIIETKPRRWLPSFRGFVWIASFLLLPVTLIAWWLA